MAFGPRKRKRKQRRRNRARWEKRKAKLRVVDDADVKQPVPREPVAPARPPDGACVEMHNGAGNWSGRQPRNFRKDNSFPRKAFLREERAQAVCKVGQLRRRESSCTISR